MLRGKQCDTITCEICKYDNQVRDLVKVKGKYLCMKCEASLFLSKREAFLEQLTAKIIISRRKKK